MAKNAKKPSVSHGKPITEFFTRSTKASASQAVPLSSAETKPPTKRFKGKGISESVEIENGQDSNPETVALLRRSQARGVSQSLLEVPRPVGSLKRSRSPESSKRATTPNAGTIQSMSIKSPDERRQNKFGSDSESEDISSVIYSNPKSNPQANKKPRLSPPGTKLSSDLPGMIPSSQSDEEELFMESNTNAYNTGSSQGKDVTHLVVQDGQEEDVHMKTETLGDPSSWSPSSPANASRNFSQESSPLLSALSSAPPTPVALDQDSKTAKIIAEIKERAYAKVLSSPEAAPLEFNDELDSSSDEDDILTVRPMIATKPGSVQQPSTATRRSTRNMSPTMGSRGSTTLKSFTAAQKALSHKKKEPLPFASFLKEKKEAVKNGVDESAIRKAEETVRKLYENDGNSPDPFDNEDSDEVLQDAALLLEQSQRSSMDRSSSPRNLAEVKKTLFSKKGSAKGVLGVLAQDKDVQRHDQLAERHSGIKFWLEQPVPDTAMSVDETPSTYQLPGDSAIVRVLNSSLSCNDTMRASMLLDNNFMLSVGSMERIPIAASLYDLAFSLPARHANIHESAFQALEIFWASSAEPSASSISFSQVLKTIQSLGASHCILSAQSWPLNQAPQVEGLDISISLRNLIIQRLLILIDCCASSRRIGAEDASDIIVLVLLVGMDSTTPPEISRDVVHTLDLLARCISPDGLISSQIESALCSKIVKYANTCDPINKVRLVSLLSSGSGPIRRVANFVAYCIVTDKSKLELIRQSYSDPPPLLDIVGKLIPRSKSSSSGPGKFAVHEQTDYVDLGLYITILGVAVSNLRYYATHEGHSSNAEGSEGPAKSGEKLKTDLQLLHGELEKLHANIVDTKATHLERSRTKAIIKGLAMNIHYQREGWLKNDVNQKPKLLTQYFTPKKDDL